MYQKITLDVCFLQAGSTTLEKRFENSPEGHQKIEVWLSHQQFEQLHIFLEATGKYGENISEYMYQNGYEVSVVNPARIKYYGSSKLRRNKTDKADAKLIAEYCMKQNPPRWRPPSASFRQLQALKRNLDDLIYEHSSANS